MKTYDLFFKVKKQDGTIAWELEHSGFKERVLAEGMGWDAMGEYPDEILAYKVKVTKK